MCRRRAIDFLLRAQNRDGGWGGGRGAPSTVEETGVVLSALARAASDRQPFGNIDDVVTTGLEWLTDATTANVQASPIGLYFARLWYYEDPYPVVFGLSGLASTAPDRRLTTDD